ncbi:MAG: hypothetical protein AAGA54_07105 [Myxococcota bacterium]
MQQNVFVFDFARFTPAVMLGGNRKRWDSVAMHGQDLYAQLDSVPLGNLARWVFGQEQRFWPDDGLTNGELEPLAAGLVARFERDGVNDPALLDGIVIEGGVIQGHLDEDHPQGPGAAVRLRLLDVGLGRLRSWYEHEDQLLRQRNVDAECDGMMQSLGAAVRRLRQLKAEQRSTREEVMEVASALKTGATVLEMVDTFALPPSERPSAWKAIERVDWPKDYVEPPPDPAWKARFRSFRNRWTSDLLGGCAGAMYPKSHKVKFDHAANAFVDALRDSGAPYLDMLRRWDELLPGSRVVLREQLHDGFRLALLSTPARERLATGELAKLAQVAASHYSSDLTTEFLQKQPRLAVEIEGFDPALLDPEEDTALGEWLEKFDTARDLREHGSSVLDLLALGTPAIVQRLEGMTGGSKHLSAAWAWVTLAGACELSERKSASFWTFDNRDLIDYRMFKRVETDGVPENGAIKEFAGGLDGVWKIANVLARTIHLRKALAEFEEASSEEAKHAALEAVEAMFKFASTAMGVVEMGEIPDRVVYVLENGETRINLPATVGLLADAASLAIAYSNFYRVSRKRSTTRVREAAGLDVAFEALGFALAVAGAVIGAEFVVLGLVVSAVKAFVTDLDKWMPLTEFATGIQAKPAPHQYLEKLLEGLLNDDEFHKTIDELGTDEAARLRQMMEGILDDLVPAPRTATQFLWNFGGHPESNLTYPARNIARFHWGMSEGTASKVVAACVHQ